MLRADINTKLHAGESLILLGDSLTVDGKELNKGSALPCDKINRLTIGKLIADKKAEWKADKPTPAPKKAAAKKAPAAKD